MQQDGSDDLEAPYWALPVSRFGKRVRAQREGGGFTQRELSERLAELGIKLDTSAITRIESGSREPRLKEAFAIALALGVSLTALLHVADDPMNALYSAYAELDFAAQDFERAADRARASVDDLQTVAIDADVREAVTRLHPENNLGTVIDMCSDALDYFEDALVFSSMLRRVIGKMNVEIPEFGMDPIPDAPDA
jgi:transcriptional regulator with XRE-family HTH domain